MATQSLVDPQLVDQVTCGICSELLYQPVAVLDCLHVYCGACLVPWLAENATCPNCRAPVRSTQDSYSSNSLIEIVARLDPSLKRSQHDIEEAEKVYKSGMRIPIRPSTARPEHFQQFHAPCPTCTVGNPFGMTCSRPISDPSNLRAGERPIPRNETPQDHSRCHNCSRNSLIPRLRENSCSVCRITVCPPSFGPCPGGHSFNHDHREVTRFQDFRPEGEASFSNIQRNFPGLCSYSREQQAEMAADLRARHLSLSDLCTSITDSGGRQGVPRAAWMGAPAESLGETWHVSREDYVCSVCARALIEQSAENWWRREFRKEVTLQDPARVPDQPVIIAPVPPSGFMGRLFSALGAAGTSRSPGVPAAPAPASGTRWRLTATDPFPAIPPHLASSRDLRGAPLFLAVLDIDGGRHPGKAGPHLTSHASAAYGGREKTVARNSRYEIILEKSNMKWVNTSQGRIPHGNPPVEAGRETDGRPLYFAAAWISGHRVLGKTGQHLGAANVGWGNREHAIRENYNILVWA